MRTTCYLYGVDVVRLKKYVFPETILGVPVIFKVSHEFASQIEVASLRFVRSHTTTPCQRFAPDLSNQSRNGARIWVTSLWGTYLGGRCDRFGVLSQMHKNTEFLIRPYRMSDNYGRSPNQNQKAV